MKLRFCEGGYLLLRLGGLQISSFFGSPYGYFGVWKGLILGSAQLLAARDLASRPPPNWQPFRLSRWVFWCLEGSNFGITSAGKIPQLRTLEFRNWALLKKQTEYVLFVKEKTTKMPKAHGICGFFQGGHFATWYVRQLWSLKSRNWALLKRV